MISGYKVPFSEVPRQSKYPRQVPISREKSLLVYTGIQTLSEKGNQNDRFRSGQIFELHLFNRKERYKPEASHQSEKLEPAYPLRTFQNGGIISFKRALERRGSFMQGRLERCILRCSIANKLHQFVSLSFGLAPAILVFTKLMKIPVAVIKRLNGRIIINLDDIFIMSY